MHSNKKSLCYKIQQTITYKALYTTLSTIFPISETCNIITCNPDLIKAKTLKCLNEYFANII